MTAPELTLKVAKETLEKKTKNFRASDFLTTEQVEEVRKSNAKGKKSKFNAIDAYVAEIIARFGFSTYTAWKNGGISEDLMLRMIEAERAREKQKTIAIESIIITAMAGANNPTKSGNMPKSLKMAIKILKSEQQRAKGIE